jgi:thioredoxin 1
MFFAMLGAAGLLAVWMICRGGLKKMKVSNALILVAVAVIVAGVGWFRSAREGSTAGTPTPPASPAAAKKMPRIVDLGADKCIPCKQLAPILEELKKEYAGRVTVEFIDVWKNPKAGEPYKISVIPTQVFFDAEGKEVWRHVGFLPKADFIAKFAELGVK